MCVFRICIAILAVFHFMSVYFSVLCPYAKTRAPKINNIIKETSKSAESCKAFWPMRYPGTKLRTVRT